MNFPVKVEDIKNSVNIFGPDIHALQEKIPTKKTISSED